MCPACRVYLLIFAAALILSALAFAPPCLGVIEPCQNTPPQIFLQLRHNPRLLKQTDFMLTPLRRVLAESSNGFLQIIAESNDADILTLLISTKTFMDRKGLYPTHKNIRKHLLTLRTEAAGATWFSNPTLESRIKPQHVLTTSGEDGNIAGFFAETLLSLYYARKKIAFDFTLIPAYRLGIGEHRLPAHAPQFQNARLSFQTGFDFVLITPRGGAAGDALREPLIIREIGEVKISERLPSNYRQQVEAQLFRLGHGGILIDDEFFHPHEIIFEFRDGRRVAGAELAESRSLLGTIPMTSLFINSSTPDNPRQNYPVPLKKRLPPIAIHGSNGGNIYSYWFSGAAAHLLDAFDKFCYTLIHDEVLYDFVSGIARLYKINIVHVKSKELSPFVNDR